MHQVVFSHLKKTRKTFDVIINYHLTNWLKILMTHITGTVSLVWHDINSTISLTLYYALHLHYTHYGFVDYQNTRMRGIWTLREKYPNTDFFLVHILLYSDWIQENTDQKKIRIWTLLTQWYLQLTTDFFSLDGDRNVIILHLLQKLLS